MSEIKKSGWRPSGAPFSTSHPREMKKVVTPYFGSNIQVSKMLEGRATQSGRYTIPDGTSTEHSGALTSFKVLIIVPNGSRIFPLKLKPNIASTIKLYFLLISDAGGRSVMNGISMCVHCVTRLLKRSLFGLLG